MNSIAYNIVFLRWGYIFLANFCLERALNRVWEGVGSWDPFGTFLPILILIFVESKQQKYKPCADQTAYLQPDQLVSVAQ